MNYRRVYLPGGTYFFTVVSYSRQPIFANPQAIELLRESFRVTMKRFPFTIVASVIMPDHMHFIWALPEASSDFSTRWKHIKAYFSRNYSIRSSHNISKARNSKGEVYIWQRRFWEHLIRDDADFKNHFDYIHYNPVKHGYVTNTKDWAYSSFHRYLSEGVYSPDWGTSDDIWVGNSNME